MKKILMASAIALVCGAPLAFAATGNMNNGALTTQHCSYLETQMSGAKFKSQAAEDNALSLCRQDRHKNHVSKLGARSSEARSGAAHR